MTICRRTGSPPHPWGFLCVALFVAVVTGCQPPDRVSAVVIGIDGADWKVIDALAAEGRMPNLSALRERGTSGKIETLPDIPLSPAIWTSVVTGKVPTKHGISWFLVDQPDGRRVPVRSHNRRTKAIWNLLAEQERRAIAVGWWASFPAEAIGDGIIISDGLGFHGFGSTARGGDEARMAYPSERTEEAIARIPTEQQITADFATRFLHIHPDQYRRERFDPARQARHDSRNPIHLFQQYAVTAQGYASIAENLLANEPFDLFLVYFEQIDSFSHLFMRHMPPRLEWVGEDDFERYRDIVLEWYTYQDELLGRLLARIDLDTTAVFVLSDHGFKSGDRRIHSDRTVDPATAHLDHERDGIFIAAGPRIRRGRRVEGASVLDITPTLLAYLGLPVGRDMDGKVLTTIFDEEHLEIHPIRYVASYESTAAVGGSEAVAAAYDEDDLSENLAALEALGYIRRRETGPMAIQEGKEQSTSNPTPSESSPEIHNGLGRSHLARGDVVSARAEFERALALDDRNAKALLNLGLIERLRGNLPAAENLVRRAIQVDPRSAAALAQLAALARERDDLAESIRLYEQSLAVDGSRPDVILGLGDSLQRAERYADAEVAFRRVLELDPDSFEAHYNLGVTHFNQANLASAAEAYERALELQPEHPQAAAALNNLGSIALQQGRSGEAASLFQKAISASPNHVESRYNLATIRLQAGKREEAIRLLEEAAALSPNGEAIHVLLATVYLEVGRNQEAFRAFELVRRLYPRNWVAALGLSAIVAASDRPDLARPLYEEALAMGGDPAREQARVYPVLAQFAASEKSDDPVRPEAGDSTSPAIEAQSDASRGSPSTTRQ